VLGALGLLCTHWLVPVGDHDKGLHSIGRRGGGRPSVCVSSALPCCLLASSSARARSQQFNSNRSTSERKTPRPRACPAFAALTKKFRDHTPQGARINVRKPTHQQEVTGIHVLRLRYCTTAPPSIDSHKPPHQTKPCQWNNSPHYRTEVALVWHCGGGQAAGRARFQSHASSPSKTSLLGTTQTQTQRRNPGPFYYLCH